ncbi:hypothetical protein GCM10028828_10670 [Corynebacterium tapiri]
MGRSYQPKHRATSPSGLALLGLTMKDRARLLIAGGATVAIAASGVVIVPVAFHAEPAAQAAELTADGTNVIESGVATAENETINGQVTRYLGGNPGDREKDFQLPMAGVRVYAKWVESDGSTSPIYTAVTDANGEYHIKMLDFKDPNGVTRRFDADPNWPEKEKIRVWSDNPDPSKWNLMFNYMNGQVGPKGVVADTTGGAAQLIGPNQYVNVAIQYVPIQDHTGMHLDNPKYVATSPDPASGPGGQINGSVHWNYNVPEGNQIYSGIAERNPGDVPIPNMRVRGSYLTDKAIKKIYAEAPKALGFRNIRGAGWNRQQELQLQDWIKQQIKKDGKAFWIAETVETTTGSDGKYSLHFNGTWGPRWDFSPNGLNVVGWPQNKKDRLGTLVSSPAEGTWSDTDVLAFDAKHINLDWTFVSIPDQPGQGLMTPYVNNQYFNPGGKGWPGVSEGKVPPTFTYGNSSFTGVDFALFSEKITFDVTPFDSFKNFATAGDTVNTRTTGLPFAQNNGTRFRVVWTDQNEKEVKGGAQCTFDVRPDGSIPSCDFKTPTDLTKQTTYTARLYSVAPDGVVSTLPVAVDSFTVDPAPKITSDNTPNYAPTNAALGGTTTVKAPTFDNPKTTDVVETNAAPANTKFEPGVPADGSKFPSWVKVDSKSGALTVTPDAGIAPGDYQVPVAVTYSDGSKDTAVATVTVKAATTAGLDPKYVAPGAVQPGGSVTVAAPTSTQAVEKTAAPAGTKFEPGVPGAGQTVPSWATVNADGTITVKPDAKAPAGSYQVPVLVTYPDGSTDTVSVPVTVKAAG